MYNETNTSGKAIRRCLIHVLILFHVEQCRTAHSFKWHFRVTNGEVTAGFKGLARACRGDVAK
jgi:hypothetical protein